MPSRAPRPTPTITDMGVAFTNNPMRKLDDTCARSIKVKWDFPAWTKSK